MKVATAFTEKSFTILGRGVILELKHLENGLPKGTLLTSSASGLKWQVFSRLLMDHAIQDHIIFDSEFVDYACFTFKDTVKRDESISDIVLRESQGIYQYLVMPIDHDSKPLEHEELTIKLGI